MRVPEIIEIGDKQFSLKVFVKNKKRKKKSKPFQRKIDKTRSIDLYI